MGEGGGVAGGMAVVSWEQSVSQRPAFGIWERVREFVSLPPWKEVCCKSDSSRNYLWELIIIKNRYLIFQLAQPWWDLWVGPLKSCCTQITFLQLSIKWKWLSHVWLFATPWTIQSLEFSRPSGVGSLSLLQGIFPTQGLNPGLPHCRRILNKLSHQGSAYPCNNK